MKKGILIDACVLYQALLRDILLSAAKEGLFRVHWSSQIIEEVRRIFLRENKITNEDAFRLESALNQAFPGASSDNYQHILDKMKNHPGDRHVLAAAVAAEASMILTHNIKDFPNEALLPFNIEAIRPDDFLSSLLENKQETMIKIINQRIISAKRPPLTMDLFLEKLNKVAPHSSQRLKAIFSQ